MSKQTHGCKEKTYNNYIKGFKSKPLFHIPYQKEHYISALLTKTFNVKEYVIPNVIFYGSEVFEQKRYLVSKLYM